MNVNEVIESYVRDVARCLPRAQRNDEAFELRALLDEELASRAQTANRAPDKRMVMALLHEFGRPAEAAQRYHTQPALIDGADTHHFLIWALGGTLVLGMHASVSTEHLDLTAALLEWLGMLLVFFTAAGWWRRSRPDHFAWKPTPGPDWMPRGLSVLSIFGLLLFPIFMYAAPTVFARLLLPGTISVQGLALTDAFAGSWQRALTLALLLGLALQHGIALLLGRRRPWLRRVEVIMDLSLGVLFVTHASPLRALSDGSSFSVFRSIKTQEVAAPIFLGVGAMMLLFGIYYAYREWSLVRPAPAAPSRAV